MFGFLAVLCLVATPFALADEIPPQFGSCDIQLPAGQQHSLVAITMSPKVTQENGNKNTTLLPIIAKATPATQAVLAEWDITKKGNTLMLPANVGPDGTPLLEQYPELANISDADADAMIRAHIIPDTLDYTTLLQKVKDSEGAGYTVESLQGFEWTFVLKGATGEGANGYIVLADPASGTTNVTDSDFAEIPMKPDLSVVDSCQNRVYLVKGFAAVPSLLTEAPVPAPDAPPPPSTTPRVPPADPSPTPPPPGGEESSAQASGRNYMLLAATGLGAAALAALL